MTAAHPIDRAWLSTGGTGAQNYDEFADETRITRIIEENPTSILAVEMPDRTPEAREAGLDFDASLLAATERLHALQRGGRFTAVDDIVVAYRITGPDSHTAYGMFCMIDTDEISTSAEEPGRVIRNEDVFIEKVRQRAKLNATLDHLLSPVLLVRDTDDDELQRALEAACVGKSAIADTDEAGRVHEVWPIAADTDSGRRLCELAGGGELIVADGNHRSLAAQVGHLKRFLAVVTTPQSVTIQPYHRLVADLPTSVDDLFTELERLGATLTPVDGELATPTEPGVVALYADGRVCELRLPDVDGDLVERLDHSRVEKLLFNRVLDMDAGDKRITYVGGDYPPSWLRGRVDDGEADLAILIHPVTVADFISVNVRRLKLPRKSTWFVPKARAGLVLADLR